MMMKIHSAALLLMTWSAASFQQQQPYDVRQIGSVVPRDSIWSPSQRRVPFYFRRRSWSSPSPLFVTNDRTVVSQKRHHQQHQQEQDSWISSQVAKDRRTTFELPDIHNRTTLTPTEREFRNLLTDFAHYTERDICSVPSPRMRILFEGVKASAGEPDVYRSFEVLFCDYLPIRLAGRLIYKKLRRVMDESQALRRREVQRVSECTGLDADEVDMLRIAFLSIAQENHYKDGQVFVTKRQLEESGIGDIVLHKLGYANVDAFFERLHHSTDGKLSFEEVMRGLFSYAVDSCFADMECNPSQVLHLLLIPLLENDSSNFHRTLDERHQRYSDRYDEMIVAFSKWESIAPSLSSLGEGRQLDVLRGCFVGARNEKVLEALRIVYVDYQPLRVAGNLIFSLMKALVKSRQT